MSFMVKSPRTIEEAIAALSDNNKQVIAGGTDLMVLVSEGSLEPTSLVNIECIEELKNIVIEEDTLKIGSMVTFSEFLKSNLIPGELKCLKEAAIHTGGPQIRNGGTLGGNICTASPAGDMISALLALEAKVQVEGIDGIRSIELKNFFVGPKKTVMKKNELLTFIYVPLKKMGNSTFLKIGKRNSLIIATANMSMYMNYTDKVEDIKIAVGSVSPTPLRVLKCEEYLLGKTITKETVEVAKSILQDTISPITDLRATASYRNKVAANMLEDCLIKLSKKEGGKCSNGNN